MHPTDRAESPRAKVRLGLDAVAIDDLREHIDSAQPTQQYQGPTAECRLSLRMQSAGEIWYPEHATFVATEAGQVGGRA